MSKISVLSLEHLTRKWRDGKTTGRSCFGLVFTELTNSVYRSQCPCVVFFLSPPLATGAERAGDRSKNLLGFLGSVWAIQPTLHSKGVGRERVCGYDGWRW